MRKQRLEPVEILNYPQLFWITAACLDTIYEPEFEEALTMLEQLLERLDLSDPALVKLFHEKKPAGWEGDFDGLQDLGSPEVYFNLLKPGRDSGLRPRQGRCQHERKTRSSLRWVVSIPFDNHPRSRKTAHAL